MAWRFRFVIFTLFVAKELQQHFTQLQKYPKTFAHTGFWVFVS